MNEHIAEQIETVKCIEAKGYTYRTGDGSTLTRRSLMTTVPGLLNVEGLRLALGWVSVRKRNLDPICPLEVQP